MRISAFAITSFLCTAVATASEISPSLRRLAEIVVDNMMEKENNSEHLDADHRKLLQVDNDREATRNLLSMADVQQIVQAHLEKDKQEQEERERKQGVIDEYLGMIIEETVGRIVEKEIALATRAFEKEAAKVSDSSSDSYSDSDDYEDESKSWDSEDESESWDSDEDESWSIDSEDDGRMKKKRKKRGDRKKRGSRDEHGYDDEMESMEEEEYEEYGDFEEMKEDKKEDHVKKGGPRKRKRFFPRKKFVLKRPGGKMPAKPGPRPARPGPMKMPTRPGPINGKPGPMKPKPFPQVPKPGPVGIPTLPSQDSGKDAVVENVALPAEIEAAPAQVDDTVPTLLGGNATVVSGEYAGNETAATATNETESEDDLLLDAEIEGDELEIEV